MGHIRFDLKRTRKMICGCCFPKNGVLGKLSPAMQWWRRQKRDRGELVVLRTGVSNRPRRWIVTIPSLDQWLATIGNHWKTIVSNEKTIEKPSVPMVCQTQNHWKTIVSKGKTIEKPLVPMVGQTKTIEKPSLPMVCQTKNHWYRWLLSNHSFKGTSEYENLGVLQLKSQ